MVDGILNALTLASGRLLEGGSGTSPSLAARVGAAASLTTLFVFFVAHYAELRAELVRAERELNLTAHGQLATSALGRQVLGDSALGAAVAATCGLFGASVPLLLAMVLPRPTWLSLPLTIGLLGVLGGLMARSFQGRAILWGPVVMLGGVVLAFVGMELNLVG